MHRTSAQAKEAVEDVVKRDPRQFGVNRTRWNLPTLLTQFPQFRLVETSSLWHVLDRLGIRWLRGRAHVHSPDSLYQAKRERTAQIEQ